jgi:hypothetical protein
LGFTLGQAISRESSAVMPRKLRASLIFGYYTGFAVVSIWPNHRRVMLTACG